MNENRCPVCGKGELPAGEAAHYRGLLGRRAPSPVVAEVVKEMRRVLAEEMAGECDDYIEGWASRLERGE